MSGRPWNFNRGQELMSGGRGQAGSRPPKSVSSRLAGGQDRFHTSPSQKPNQLLHGCPRSFDQLQEGTQRLAVFEQAVPYRQPARPLSTGLNNFYQTFTRQLTSSRIALQEKKSAK